MKKNRIISNTWDPVTARGEIVASYEGAQYTYALDSKYYYSKIVEIERRGGKWIPLLITFNCIKYHRGK
ncbi:MAG: hypothetical protein KAS66_00165 [Candidatus Omnitrophica bacterium]|nr:hypothetical protein [Candidatus Omnitrophota bacterium]